MRDKQPAASLAAEAIKQLDAMHKSFMSELEIAAMQTPEVGSLTAAQSQITCACLGHKIIARHRPVALDGKVSAVEYDFTVNWRGDPLSVLRLYLQPGGDLTRDLAGTVQFQSFKNSYIHSHILEAVAQALLASPVFGREG